MSKEGLEGKEKTRGQEFLLKDLDERFNDLSKKKKKGRINEEEYRVERERPENERLGVLTRPD